MPSYSYFKTHPLRLPADNRETSIGSVLKAETAMKAALPKNIEPAAGAFIHYGGVELADKLSILSPPATDEDLQMVRAMWNASCGLVCRTLLFYVWKIIAKEQRHGSASMAGKAFGPEYKSNPWQKMVADINTSGDYEGVLVNNAALSVGPYVDAVEKHYRNGGWSGSFGGKKWADIALQFKLYIDGEASAMIAADRCWTLVHNTGPIFNKGFYFEHHDHRLMEVLNAQAKTSVFDLGLSWPKEVYGANPLTVAFDTFCQKSVELIQKVEPDYQPGVKVSGDPKPAKSETQKRRFGPVTIEYDPQGEHDD